MFKIDSYETLFNILYSLAIHNNLKYIYIYDTNIYDELEIIYD